MSTILDALRKLQEEAAAERRRSKQAPETPRPAPTRSVRPSLSPGPLDLSAGEIPVPLSDEGQDQAEGPDQTREQVEGQRRAELFSDGGAVASSDIEIVSADDQDVDDDEVAVAPPRVAEEVPQTIGDETEGSILGEATSGSVADAERVLPDPVPEVREADVERVAARESLGEVQPAAPESTAGAASDLPPFEPETAPTDLRKRVVTWGGIAAGILVAVLVGQRALDYFTAPQPVAPIARTPVAPKAASPSLSPAPSSAESVDSKPKPAVASKEKAVARTAGASPSAGGPPRASTRAPAESAVAKGPKPGAPQASGQGGTSKPAKAEKAPKADTLTVDATRPTVKPVSPLPPSKQAPAAAVAPQVKPIVKGPGQVNPSPETLAKLGLESVVPAAAQPAAPLPGGGGVAAKPPVAPLAKVAPAEPEVLLKAPQGAPQISLVFVQWARDQSRRMASVRNAAGVLLVLREGDLADPAQGLRVASIGRSWVDFSWRNETYRLFMNEY